MSTPIAEDFIAIRARLAAIREAERPPHVQAAEGAAPPVAANPADFYAWLMGGGLWAGGN